MDDDDDEGDAFEAGLGPDRETVKPAGAARWVRPRGVGRAYRRLRLRRPRPLYR